MTIFFSFQLFWLLTQRVDYHRQPSSWILGRLVLLLLASWLGNRPSHTWLNLYPLVSIHDWSCLSIHMACVIDLAFLLHSLSITFAPSQSIMQLFLFTWSVNADWCYITVDTLFCSLLNRLVVMFSTSFLRSSSLVPNVLPISPIYVWSQLLQRTWCTQSVVLLSSTLSFRCTSNLLILPMAVEMLSK